MEHLTAAEKALYAEMHRRAHEEPVNWFREVGAFLAMVFAVVALSAFVLALGV